MAQSRVRYTSEEAVNQIGNRFDLIIIAAKRVRELRSGHRPKITTKAGAVVTALEEIEAGLIGRNYLKK